MRDSCWIVDALLGTGIQGMVREPFAGIISAANRQALRPDGPRILAIDLPSGLDCDTGQILGVCIQADLTATCVAPKIGFRQNEGLSHTGKVHVIDIGVPHEVLEGAIDDFNRFSHDEGLDHCLPCFLRLIDFTQHTVGFGRAHRNRVVAAQEMDNIGNIGNSLNDLAA